MTARRGGLSPLMQVMVALAYLQPARSSLMWPTHSV